MLRCLQTADGWSRHSQRTSKGLPLGMQITMGLARSCPMHGLSTRFLDARQAAAKDPRVWKLGLTGGRLPPVVSPL